MNEVYWRILKCGNTLEPVQMQDFDEYDYSAEMRLRGVSDDTYDTAAQAWEHIRYLARVGRWAQNGLAEAGED